MKEEIAIKLSRRLSERISLTRAKLGASLSAVSDAPATQSKQAMAAMLAYAKSQALDFEKIVVAAGYPGPRFLLAQQDNLGLTDQQIRRLTYLKRQVAWHLVLCTVRLKRAYSLYTIDASQAPLPLLKILSDIQRVGRCITGLTYILTTFYWKASQILTPSQQDAVRVLLPPVTVASSATPSIQSVDISTLTEVQRHETMKYFATHSLEFGPRFIATGHPGPRYLLLHAKELRLTGKQIAALKPLAFEMEQNAANQVQVLKSAYELYAWDVRHPGPDQLQRMQSDIFFTGQQTIVLASIMIPTHLSGLSLLTCTQRQVAAHLAAKVQAAEELI
ncbi:MAG: hypothetical protein OWS74_06745 [Firmicutes bacterium]|nr:hypothetical protein [Bacillota bacterium]